MAISAHIENLERLVAKLRDMAAKVQKDKAPVGVVGYTQEYALYVHEDMEANHPVGQAKYLEQPLRELNNSGVLSAIVTQAVQRGQPLGTAILLACLRLQRESQALVPVSTGALRASAFTKME